MLSPKRINIELTNCESLVLYEFLHRCHDDFALEDESEETVLLALEGQLEKQLVEIMSPNYMEYLEESRNQIQDGD